MALQSAESSQANQKIDANLITILKFASLVSSTKHRFDHTIAHWSLGKVQTHTVPSMLDKRSIAMVLTSLSFLPKPLEMNEVMAELRPRLLHSFLEWMRIGTGQVTSGV